MATYISHSPADTEALGEQWGRAAQSGLVLALSGDLGAGKTQLVKGLARGLGAAARVQSPTFTLVNEYAGGRLRLFHLDLYRLETPAQIESAGVVEFLQPDGVAVIVECNHSCMSSRGVQKVGALTKTSCVRGVFKNDHRTLWPSCWAFMQKSRPPSPP